MKLLNSGYLDNTNLDNGGSPIKVNNNLYYNAGSETCYSYNEKSNITTTGNSDPYKLIVN